nr:cingulin-like protein 1 [Salvelinus alpinus]
MTIQVDDEHMSIQNQKDQLNQRLKTAKRQMDGAEQEIELLENSKRKLQRDLDERMETNEQVLSQLNTLRSEMRRKQQKSAPLLMILKGVDDINTD